MTLTKAELADLLFEKVGFNKREAKDMVESFFEEVRTALESGKGVKLSGFGNFQLRDKPQRPGRWGLSRSWKLPKPESLTPLPLSRAVRTSSKKDSTMSFA